jgi:hypothetical protein
MDITTNANAIHWIIPIISSGVLPKRRIIRATKKCHGQYVAMGASAACGFVGGIIPLCIWYMVAEW